MNHEVSNNENRKVPIPITKVIKETNSTIAIAETPTREFQRFLMSRFPGKVDIIRLPGIAKKLRDAYDGFR